MIKNGLAEGMVTRKLCVEVLDLVLTSFQTSFFSSPTVSKVQITDMLLLSTSFFSYPLPRSHRQGGFEKKKASIHKLFLSFPNKGGCLQVGNNQQKIAPANGHTWEAEPPPKLQQTATYVGEHANSMDHTILWDVTI